MKNDDASWPGELELSRKRPQRTVDGFRFGGSGRFTGFGKATAPQKSSYHQVWKGRNGVKDDERHVQSSQLTTRNSRNYNMTYVPV